MGNGPSEELGESSGANSGVIESMTIRRGKGFLCFDDKMEGCGLSMLKGKMKEKIGSPRSSL